MDLAEMLTQRPVTPTRGTPTNRDKEISEHSETFAAAIEAEQGEAAEAPPDQSQAEGSDPERGPSKDTKAEPETPPTDKATDAERSAESSDLDADVVFRPYVATTPEEADLAPVKLAPLRPTQTAPVAPDAVPTAQTATDSQPLQVVAEVPPKLEVVTAPTQTPETAKKLVPDATVSPPVSQAPKVAPQAQTAPTLAEPSRPTQAADIPEPDLPIVVRTKPGLEKETKDAAPLRNAATVAGSTPGSTPVRATAEPQPQAELPPSAPPPPASTGRNANGAPEADLASRPIVQESAKQPAPEPAPRTPVIDAPGPSLPRVETDTVPRIAQTASGEAAASAVSTAGSAATRFATTAGLGFTPLPSDFQTPAMVDRQIAPQIVSAAGTRASGGVVEVMLDPPELGRVEISMELTDQTLRATISVERPATADLLRRHLDILMQQFSDAGFDQIDLGFGTETNAGDVGSDAQTGSESDRDDVLVPKLGATQRVFSPEPSSGTAIDMRL